MFLGIDIGSTSSKAVVIDTESRILAQAVVNIGAGTPGPNRAVAQVMETAGGRPEDLVFSVVTGYGRMVFTQADRQITEITCHAKGVAFWKPSARTVIDIGGQDAKIIRLDESGKVQNFVMNEKCAAGTGRFLEVMARILDCGLEDLYPLSQQSTQDITISSTCTVFAESEVISQLSAGVRREDVAKGAHKSVAKRVAGLGGRLGVSPEVVMTGGVALNQGVVSALEAEIGEKITVAHNPQVIGALGAALFARELAP